ncbi:MAG: hypothetical protein PF904_11165 [Kiritimatiellae bacterium]|jgi:hypothetical protein|nr:hypothetical protein [Kiritimatiellia bacterium]
MEFIPAGEIIGEAHRVRTVGLRKSPHLPDGDYTFVDMYCIDPDCDCRKTMIQVMRNGIHVGTINFGWESPEFYRKWMGGDEDESMPDLHGATIDITSPNRVSPQGMLSFFHALLDEKWITLIKSHYSAVKARLAKKTMQK